MQLNPRAQTGPKRRYAPLKYLLVMKLIILLTTIACLHVSARTHAQSISLSKTNAPLTEVFSSIKQQTSYKFFWKGDDLSGYKITVTLKNATIAEVMDKILKDLPLTYTITENTIVIRQKETSPFDNLKSKIKALIAQVTITGKVQDETGQPLPGVTVRIKGTNTATSTDVKGQYSITAPDDKSIVAFSFIGYEAQELQAKDIPNGSVIKLKASETNLKEVVVSKGYYNEKRELLTGNVTIVSAKVIGEQPVSDPILTLEGRVPGLYISQTSGIPGAGSTVRLRGQNSIANGSNPLYIVNGVPFSSNSLTSPDIGGGAVGSPFTGTGVISSSGLSPFNNLNPADIESIEVLKDADATAIYGSRGANGVILITTKKGKAGQTRVDVDYNSGIGTVAHTIPFLNTQQYLAMRHEAFKNDGVLPTASDYDVNGTWDTTRYTNWEKVFIGNTSHFTNANVSLSGGNTNTQFRLSGGYSRQTTVFPGDFNDQKASMALSLSHTSTNQKFHADFNVQYVEDNNVLPTGDFSSYQSLAPDAPALYDGNGNVNWQNGTFFNPVSGSLVNASAITDNLNSSLRLAYDILPSLKLQSNFGYSHLEMNQSIQTPAASFYGPAVTTNRENDIANTYNNTWIIEPQLNYIKKISKGQLDMLIGTSIQRSIYNTLGQAATGFSSDDLIKNVANASAIRVSGSSYTDYRYVGLYAHLGYNWGEKYIVNITARRDGSSRFGPGNQFGNFGSLGAGWIFSKESLIENALPFLSFGKLKASYGTTGNDQIVPYQYLSTYSASGNYQNTAALGPNRIASPYFAWEVVNKLEAGLELGFLKNRIQLEADYYRNRTGNQLVGQPLATQNGFSSIQANLPAVVQNAGIELELNTVNIKGSKFNWTSSFNFSRSRNKLVSFPGLAYNSTYVNAYVVGQPIYSRKMYHFTGVDAQTGLYTFQDLNGDGVLTVADRQLIKTVAQDYFGGFQNNFSYGDWQLDVFFQFVKQTGLGVLNVYVVGGSFNQNMPTAILNRWQNPGDVTDIAKFTTFAGPSGGAGNSNITSSDRFITDASFIRLKNVSLSYSLPQSWQHTLGLQSARIYLQGQNLLTFTNYIGFDPETQGTSLPPLRMISLGIHASL
jgi:TonB-linked SusC/RagA family outer membrane protein